MIISDYLDYFRLFGLFQYSNHTKLYSDHMRPIKPFWTLFRVMT